MWLKALLLSLKNFFKKNFKILLSGWMLQQEFKNGFILEGSL